jgi:hypothetical protein
MPSFEFAHDSASDGARRVHDADHAQEARSLRTIIVVCPSAMSFLLASSMSSGTVESDSS